MVFTATMDEYKLEIAYSELNIIIVTRIIVLPVRPSKIKVAT